MCLMVNIWSGCQPSATSPDVQSQITTDQIAEAPGLKEATSVYVGPLADAIDRMDPVRDGWESEAFSEYASGKLKDLAKLLTVAGAEDRWKSMESSLFTASPRLVLLPESNTTLYSGGGFSVERPAGFSRHPDGGVASTFEALLQNFRGATPDNVEMKLFRVIPSDSEVTTHIYFHASGPGGSGSTQLNGEWKIVWVKDPMGDRIASIQALTGETVHYSGRPEGAQFEDGTVAILGHNASYAGQLLRSTDDWRTRLTRDHGLDVLAHHGFALADVNGDSLEDLYLCQQGGLPNRLFLQNPDGTLTDFTEPSRTGWLDYSTSALLIDLDNDGARDLVVCMDFKVVILRNNGSAVFSQVFETRTHAQSFSMSAADYDLDGDLDIYVCGYNPSSDRIQSGAMGEPIPYHDAQNGGKNILLQNDGGWKFSDATEGSGLNQNNSRFSFAASWEDFDADGDLDLYVANDYGRNNFYVNDGGRFSDRAQESGVEDMSAGMSVIWGDVNRDGMRDIYVSNMFSSAGNRIAFQRQFKPGLDEQTLHGFQRHARGNTLFLGEPDLKSFRDVSEDMGVTMGRWAWGARFGDFNNDGWEDIVVANGFITTDDTGDL